MKLWSWIRYFGVILEKQQIEFVILEKQQIEIFGARITSALICELKK